MRQSKNLFRSTLVLAGCFLALNLHIAYGQDDSTKDLKPVCPTESASQEASK